MEKEFVCKFCNKKFPSGKSLGGHIRIHSPNKKKRLVGGQREITTPLQQQQQQLQKCRLCGKGFSSLQALANHMDCHVYEGEKKKTQSSSDTTTTTSSGPTMIERSKKQSNSESLSTVSDPDVYQAAKDLMFLHLGRKEYNLADSSDNNSEILETKSSSEELPKTSGRVAVDDSDNGSSESDYFMNGAKKSESGISVGGSLRNTAFGSSGFNSSSLYADDEVRNKEGGGSKHDELISKRKRVSPSYESDPSADTNSKKIHRSSDSNSPRVKKAIGANKNSKVHECPVCFKVYSSGPALGGHKRAHAIANQEERIKHKAAADMQFDLNLPAEDCD